MNSVVDGFWSGLAPMWVYCKAWDAFGQDIVPGGSKTGIRGRFHRGAYAGWPYTKSDTPPRLNADRQRRNTFPGGH